MAIQGRQWALISNASAGGIGEAYAIAFRRRGINVVATAADVDSMEYLEPDKGSDDGFLVTLQLDVTSPKSIIAAVKQVNHLTDGNLHFLLNSSDSAYYVPLMDADLDQAKQQYDTSVGGLLAVTQAFFPLLRASKGMVINQTGVAGLQGCNKPFAGIDSSTKAAIISLSSALRIELVPFDIKVVTLVSGDVQTEIFDDMSGDGVPQSSAYFPIKEEVDQVMSSYSAVKGRDRYQVANETVDQLLGDNPSPYIRKGYMASFNALLYWLVPTSMLDSWASKSGSLDRLKRLLSGTPEEKKDD